MIAQGVIREYTSGARRCCFDIRMTMISRLSRFGEVDGTGKDKHSHTIDSVAIASMYVR
ncbi:hypothetical protein SERLA73DRAFT_143451 [Serpula lacrymans var. lacrymans S7.3]|uniref:Uncharacterized protein n=2 Tax=Serpula lacrymans var. lacrymans TaxID=341189 RepID=F8QA44_SERL3|nr:uncharacterized protein SERLADRAFT_400148 [Serpula lacrymans var. lacrymans S7.9]EGN94634.1 hypothetical protein SERLA73DRAFT_143451 [Serpula lacrymans var. lacrymans S7.3]EGO20114.1 hypothetical protein SERLADRAFT_400148 [Serpula lacrymans var. lacrymans S7.9]